VEKSSGVQSVHKAVKITLIILGSLVGVLLLLFLGLVIAGSQNVTDPFPNVGVEVIDAPFSGESVTMTWKVHGTVESTGVYISATSVADFPQGVTPAQAGYSGLIEPTLKDGIYSATVPVNGPVVYARVWARADDIDWWSVEYPIVRGAT